MPAYPSFAEAPGPVDLVLVAVPPDEVIACVEEAADAGARAAVVITSGFAEMGSAGAALQRELVRTARERGIRVVGPNCLGLLDNQPDVRLSATFGGANPPTGGLAIASQSGGVGIVVIDLARRLGLGVGHFVSLGNKADVSGNDLLAAWADDPDVTAAALYLESFGNPAKFARVGRRFAESKPLLGVVGGRSGSGQRAGASHTAAAATAAVRIDALFAQAGVIACRDAEELTETALLLAEQPLPTGPRVAVLATPVAWGCWLPTPRPTTASRSRSCPRASGRRSPVTSREPSGPPIPWMRVRAEAQRTWAGSPLDSSRPTRWTRCCSCSPRHAPSTPRPTLSALARGRRAHPAKPMVRCPPRRARRVTRSRVSRCCRPSTRPCAP